MGAPAWAGGCANVSGDGVDSFCESSSLGRRVLLEHKLLGNWVCKFRLGRCEGGYSLLNGGGTPAGSYLNPV